MIPFLNPGVRLKFLSSEFRVRSVLMRSYPYLQKERRSGKERRKSRVPVGITFEFVDRRQKNDPYYSGFERRSGLDRRGLIWDRRTPKVPCYC